MSKEKFIKVYSNLPEPEREQIIAIIDNRPYTWNVAYNEINKKTEIGKKILKKIKELGLLWKMNYMKDKKN